MQKKDDVLIELVEYCCEKLRQIDGEIIIAKTNNLYETTLDKLERISKIETQIMCYTDLIKKLNEIKDR